MDKGHNYDMASMLTTQFNLILNHLSLKYINYERSYFLVRLLNFLG